MNTIRQQEWESLVIAWKQALDLAQSHLGQDARLYVDQVRHFSIEDDGQPGFVTDDWIAWVECSAIFRDELTVHGSTEFEAIHLLTGLVETY